jgi:hypothetical protein
MLHKVELLPNNHYNNFTAKSSMDLGGNPLQKKSWSLLTALRTRLVNAASTAVDQIIHKDSYQPRFHQQTTRLMQK